VPARKVKAPAAMAAGTNASAAVVSVIVVSVAVASAAVVSAVVVVGAVVVAALIVGAVVAADFVVVTAVVVGSVADSVASEPEQAALTNARVIDKSTNRRIFTEFPLLRRPQPPSTDYTADGKRGIL
jgi:hypothetical protein